MLKISLKIINTTSTKISDDPVFENQLKLKKGKLILRKKYKRTT